MGSYYRIGDSVVPNVAFNMGNYQLCLSYDVNISGFKAASQYKGGLEVGIRMLTSNPFSRKTFSVKNGDKRILKIS